MKNIFTKCLVLSALAIGMSSNVMAEELVVKSSHAPKLTPIAFEVNEGDNKATALLLLGKKGDVNGLICYTNPTVPSLGDDCYRVTGKISQYEGSNHIELLGNEIKSTKIIQTTTLITYEHTIVTPQINMSTATKQIDQNSPDDKAVGGIAQSINVKYQAGIFQTNTLEPIAYAGIAQPQTGCYPVPGGTLCI